MGEVIWDGFGLQSTHSGVGRYAFEVGTALAAQGCVPVVLPTVPHLDRAFAAWEAHHDRFRWGRIKPLSLWASQRMAEYRAKRGGLSIYHGLSNYNVPDLSSSFRCVLTIHDLIPSLNPDGVSTALRTYLSYQMPRAIKRADVILCVSEWTAETVKAHYPKATNKIVVLLNGKPNGVLPQARGTDDKFRLLTVSRGERYKRLDLINEILPSLPESFEWHLLSDERGHGQVFENKRLIRYQSLSETSLAQLWLKADALVHPSLLEGYCLPAASAVAHGIPTILTSGSGIGEVVGSAGLALAPTDRAEAWIAAIKLAAEQRESYPALCRAQWERLPSWAEVGGQIADIYAKLKS